MPCYHVGHAYRAELDGEPVVLIAGSVVEVDETRANRINVDSPGTLNPVPDPDPKPESGDRQDTGGHKRTRRRNQG